MASQGSIVDRGLVRMREVVILQCSMQLVGGAALNTKHGTKQTRCNERATRRCCKHTNPTGLQANGGLLAGPCAGDSPVISLMESVRTVDSPLVARRGPPVVIAHGIRGVGLGSSNR
ncbi:predicted protein [Verticillium alfalfae VaMs.102]|uniref:Predicted protein n=1 Tax=Verticillium alfalfae (strain VaMs.102 / ATCC MYA-4576 / FGSC 10136) TaxID=526221 RepID=C9SX60_VERA1|nr:predicted protein [Verticillium alfalfae VaMs.102]EEY23250.1 predicted protein [Verticillium alfalfae VaMs.102]